MPSSKYLFGANIHPWTNPIPIRRMDFASIRPRDEYPSKNLGRISAGGTHTLASQKPWGEYSFGGEYQNYSTNRFREYLSDLCVFVRGVVGLTIADTPHTKWLIESRQVIFEQSTLYSVRIPKYSFETINVTHCFSGPYPASIRVGVGSAVVQIIVASLR